MLASRPTQLWRRVTVTALSTCLITAIGPVTVDAVGSRISAADSAPAPSGTGNHIGRSVSAAPGPPVTKRRAWPSGEAAGGGTVSWTAHPARQTDFRHATGWWGAAGTKIKIRGAAAPHVYRFHMRLPRHVRLSKNRFGEVVARRHGHAVGILGRPWAKNSRGHAVRTWYTLHGHTVKQHVAFGPHARFPITADPWWNPFTWQWGEAFSVAWTEVTTCGKGAMNAVLSIGGTTGTTNILLKHVAGKAALMIPGGAYTYAGFAAWGCIGSFF